jgi:hypothetical protein
MSVTMVRTNWIDDDGTGTTGTVLNNAIKQELYDQIDQALTKVPQLAGGNTFTGNQTINGIVGVNGFGTHLFLGSGVGEMSVRIQNPAAGSSNSTSLYLGNDAAVSMFVLTTYASNHSGAPGWSYLQQSGAGLRFFAQAASGVFEFWTNGAKRWSIDPVGAFITGPYSAGSAFTKSTPGLVEIGNAGTVAINHMVFFNANNICGQIQTAGNTTTYGTSSDARLKTDRGIARDTSILERTEIHDYEWNADGTPGRGVFSQDAHKVLPAANAPGTDERDDDGRLVKPWSTDYSKYVPDLIVGWQQHKIQLAALRAELDALKGRN